MRGVGQRDQAGPHRDATHEVGGAVDRVDHPTPWGFTVAGHAVFFTEQSVVGPATGNLGADCRLGLPVRLGDLRAVRLPREVERALLVERQRDAIGDVGQFERERQVGGEIAIGDHWV